MDFETILASQRLASRSQSDAEVRHIAALGQKAVTLQATPEWQMYAEHIEALRQGSQNKTLSLKSRLIEGATLPQEEYVELKRQLAALTAAEKAYTACLELVQALAIRGADATKSLTITE